MTANKRTGKKLSFYTFSSVIGTYFSRLMRNGQIFKLQRRKLCQGNPVMISAFSISKSTHSHPKSDQIKPTILNPQFHIFARVAFTDLWLDAWVFNHTFGFLDTFCLANTCHLRDESIWPLSTERSFIANTPHSTKSK